MAEKTEDTSKQPDKDARPQQRKQRIKISADEFVFFNRQLASLARMDLPFRDGLIAMAREANTAEFRRVSEMVAADLDQGVPLAEALAKFPKIFSEFYIGAVKAGQESGNLADCLDTLAEHSSLAYRWRRIMSGILVYPFFLVILFILLILFLFTCILPRFIPIFDALNVPLPMPTRTVMAISLYVKSSWPWLLLEGLGIFLVGFLILRCLRRTIFYSLLVLNAPLIGSLARKSGLQLFCQMLLALLRGGMSLAPALDLISRAFGWNVFGRAIADLRDAAAEGEGIGEQCKKCGLFPQSMAWKIAVMEERGALEEALEDLSNDLSTDIEISAQNFARMIVPVMVFVLGMVVFTIVLSVFLPIFKIQQVLTGQ